MKPAIVAALLLLPLACSKKPVATSADCQPACDRVAGLRIAPKVANMRWMAHEADDAVERTEDETEKTVAQLKKEIALGGPPFDPKNFAKLPVKTQKEIAERHKWESDQLKLQREMALKRAQETLDEAKK